MWCWWCCHPPDNEFLHMPIKQHKVTNKLITVGNFCTWECMKAYAIDKYGPHMGGVICMYMRIMKGDKKVTRCAPPRISLKEFGGTLSIEEFRKHSSSTLKTCLPEMEHKLYSIVEPVKNDIQSQGQSDYKMSSIMNSQSQGDSLRLKRSKPLRRDTKNNLEKSLGLSIKQNPTLSVSGT